MKYLRKFVTAAQTQNTKGMKKKTSESEWERFECFNIKSPPF